MAANSASAKTWCVTIVAAILVLSSDADFSQAARIAFIPVVLLGVLDAYYLALERSFRSTYTTFVKKVHDGSLSTSDLYVISRHGNLSIQTIGAARSFSVWPFYGGLAVAIFLIACNVV